MSTAPKKVVSPLRHKKVVVAQKRKKVEDTVSATVNTIVQDLGNPNFLLAAGICAFLAMTHTQDPASSLVSRMAEHLKSSEGSEKIGKFIASHLLQTVGAICFTITTLLCAPKDKTGTWIIACPSRDVTATVSAHTLRKETCVVGVGCTKEYRDVTFYAHGYTSVTPPGIVQSDEYAAWPPHVAGSECVAVLETNWLTPAQCPLPAHCGAAVFHKTSISWLGEELGLCVGAGDGSRAIMEHGSPSHRNGTARSGFVRLGRLDTNSTSDYCNLSGITVTITFPNETSWLVSRAALYNVPVFNRRTGTAVVKYPRMESRAGRAHCPVHPGAVTLNPITRRLPMISLEAGSSRFTLPPMPLYLEEGITVHGSSVRTRPCLCQTVGLAETTNSALPCIPYHHVTKYALPGSSYAKDAILWIWDILAAKLVWVLANLLDLLWDAFCTVDTHIRLSEALIVLALSGWYFDQPHRAIVVTCAYVVAVGVTRN